MTITTPNAKVSVRNMTSPSTGNDVPNQFIITVNNTTYFQSYQSVIAKREYGVSIVLDRNKWDYSKTTSKYRNDFLGMTTAEIKKAIKD